MEDEARDEDEGSSPKPPFPHPSHLTGTNGEAPCGTPQGTIPQLLLKPFSEGSALWST